MAYIWSEPVTDRPDGTTYMTYLDMNRITTNIAYLQVEVMGASTVSQTSWTRNDIITKALWEELINDVAELCATLGVEYQEITNDMTYTNVNTMEQLSLAVYDRIQGGIDDYQVYGVSVVQNEVAVIDDDSFLTTSTINTWKTILGL